MVCLTAALLSFEVHGGRELAKSSLSYQQKWAKQSLGGRVAECIAIWRISTKHKVDQIWSIAIAVNESGLSADLTSPRGAKSSMQTYRRWSRCGDCDLRESGVIIAHELRRAHGDCDGAARYNAGPRGRCKGLGGHYARRVIKIYKKLKGLRDANTIRLQPSADGK